MDFDSGTWREDVSAFLETCQSHQVTAALERSRSGNGGHVWIFFSESIASRLGRQLGSVILTETLKRLSEIGLDSYDRFFPSQDTMPKGGFGNLIALPLHRRPREIGNTVFLYENFVTFPNQWAFLSSIHRMSRDEVENVVQVVEYRESIYGVTMVMTDDHDSEPWLAPPSRRRKEPTVTGPLPKMIHFILGNQICIPEKHSAAILDCGKVLLL